MGQAAQHGRNDLRPEIWPDGDWLGVRDGHDVGPSLGEAPHAGEGASQTRWDGVESVFSG